MDTSGTDLIKFLNYAADKGLVNRNTAMAMKAAATKVISVEGELDAVNVEGLDLDGLFRRFETLHKSGYTPESLETYRSRFNQAVSWFLSWNRDPAGWKPTVRAGKPAANGKKKPKPEAFIPEDMPPPERAPAVETKGRLNDYPFPVREGLNARLYLPADLKRAEAKRIVAFINTLVVDAEEA